MLQLQVRPVNRGVGILGESLLPDVIHYAHNGQPVFRFRMFLHADALADGVFIGPKALRHRMADNHHARRAGIIALCKITAAQQPDPHSAKISWTGRWLVRHITLWQFRAAFERKVAHHQ